MRQMLTYFIFHSGLINAIRKRVGALWPRGCAVQEGQKEGRRPERADQTPVWEADGRGSCRACRPVAELVGVIPRLRSRRARPGGGKRCAAEQSSAGPRAAGRDGLSCGCLRVLAALRRGVRWFPGLQTLPPGASISILQLQPTSLTVWVTFPASLSELSGNLPALKPLP